MASDKLFTCIGRCATARPGSAFRHNPQGARIRICKACEKANRLEMNRRKRGALKRCRLCPDHCALKPRTAEFFHRRRRSPDGLNDVCKVCHTAEQARWRHTPTGKARMRAYRQLLKPNRRRQSRDPAYKAKRRSWRKPVENIHKKALTAIGGAIKYGRLVRPKECQKRGCRRKHPWAFVKDYLHPFDGLRWFCGLHHYEERNAARIAEEEAERQRDERLDEKAHRVVSAYGATYGDARNLVCDRSEWREFHEEHKAALAAERWPEPSWARLGADEKPAGSALTMAQITGSELVRRWG